MRAKGVLTAMAIAMFSAPALASAVLPLQGVFGNEGGCAAFMTGDRSAAGLAVLTPDTFTTFATGCYFERLIERSDQSYTIRASCTADNGLNTKETVVVIDQGESGVLVEITGLELFGPLLPCPGTEDLFRRGVQI